MAILTYLMAGQSLVMDLVPYTSTTYTVLVMSTGYWTVAVPLAPGATMLTGASLVEMVSITMYN